MNRQAKLECKCFAVFNALPYGRVKAYALPYSRASDWVFGFLIGWLCFIPALVLRAAVGFTPFLTVGPLMGVFCIIALKMASSKFHAIALMPKSRQVT